jgi:hypothetical protein
VRRVLANDETLSICVMRSSYARVLHVLRDTSELRELGMQMDGDRAQLVIHYGDIQLMLIADRIDMGLS